MEEFRGILVVGAGIVGSYAALSLAQRGYTVRLIEFRKPFNRKESNEVLKRSINLAFSFRAAEAMRKVGLYEEVKELLVPMHGRAIHLLKRKANSGFKADQVQFYDEIDRSNFNNSVSRAELNILLLDKLQSYSNVELQYETKLLKLDKNNVATVQRNGREAKVKPVLLLGCDGAYSTVRQSIIKHNHTRYGQFYIPHGYKELSILPENGDFRLPDANFLHIWPRGDFMMIALPNLDKSFTCTLFAPLDSLNLETEAEITKYFSQYFPDFPLLVPDYLSQYRTNPTNRLVSVNVDDWKYVARDMKHAALLLGDAAHACVPFYGIGMNCGLEDVLEFCNLIDSLDKGQGLIGEDLLVTAVLKFNKQRVKDGQSCSILSYNNYKEMRSHTMSRAFLFKKKLEGLLNLLLGNRFIPLYKMVSFTRIPFSEVIERNKRQQRVLSCITTVLGLVSLLAVGAAAKASVKRVKWF